MDGDGVRANQLPTAMEPVLPKPAPKSFGLLAQYPEEGDSVSISFSMSFSFSATTTTGNGNRYGNQGHNGYWQANNGNTEPADAQGEKIYGRYVCSGEKRKETSLGSESADGDRTSG